MESFSKFDDGWFGARLEELGIDPREGPPRARDADARPEATFLDARGRDFISFFDLLNLFLLVDCCQATYGNATLVFSGFGASDEPLIPVDTYNSMRGGRLDVEGVSSRLKDAYYRGTHVYGLLSFCRHFGLFDALARSISAGRVVLQGIDSTLIGSLHEYGGAGAAGSRILPLLPILGARDVDAFRTQSEIRGWLSELDDEVLASPVLCDGEFARVFGYQLSLNILEHAGSQWKGHYGCLGAVGMRVIPPGPPAWVRGSFPEHMRKVFDIPTDRGFLEVCVGDRGQGIVHSLRDAYAAECLRYGVRDGTDVLDVVGFAFDELGSRKGYDERWGGVHALHRILRCVIKYHGAMRVRTGGLELVFDAALGVHDTGQRLPLDRTAAGFGLLPARHLIQERAHPFGVQLQVVLPLTKPARPAGIVVPRGTRRRPPRRVEEERTRVVSPAAHFRQSQGDSLKDPRLDRALMAVATGLMREPQDTKIVYDFGGHEWSEKEIAYFLFSQKSVFHTHFAIGVNLRSDVVRLLSEREAMGPLQEPARRTAPQATLGGDGVGEQEADSVGRRERDFVDALSTSRRLLPIVDTRDRVWWLGLGRHAKLRPSFDLLFQREGTCLFEELTRAAGVDIDSWEAEILSSYLDSNRPLLEHIQEPPLDGWHCRASASGLAEATERLIRTKLPAMLGRLNCVLSGDLYKLPSKAAFTDHFIQITPLLQDEVASQQVGEWMAAAVRRLLGEQRSVTLACATAPGLLLTRTIAYAMPEYEVHLLDLGYYHEMDPERLVRSSEWNAPFIVIGDVVREGRTLSRACALLEDRGIHPIGEVVAIRLSQDLKPMEVGNTLFWEPEPAQGGPADPTPRFILAEVGAGQTVDHDIGIRTWDESRRWLIEPYSLEKFRYSSLSGRKHRSRKDTRNRERLALLEKAEALRAGHWVFGSHHFELTVCLRRMFEDDDVAGSICADIIRLCGDEEVDHILLPLHSSIGDLLPRISSGLKIVNGSHVEHTFCVSSKVLAKRPFYSLPQGVQELLRRNASSEGEGLRFLILDDAVATGRTLETILRALIRAARKAVGPEGHGKCPLGLVRAYAVLDRQGRARGTFTTGIRRMSLSGDEEWVPEREHEFSLKYDRWIDLDMPVHERESCSLCKERSILQGIAGSCGLPDDHPAMREISQRIAALMPRSTEAPSFCTPPKQELEAGIAVGNVSDIKTLELALWVFHQLVQRGCPFSSLADDYAAVASVAREAGAGDDTNIMRLLREMGRVFFREWERLASQSWEREWFQLATREIEAASANACAFVGEAGRCLATTQSSHTLLENLFLFAAERIADLDDEADEETSRRGNLAAGCALFCLYFQHCAGSGSHDAPALPERLLVEIQQLTGRDIESWRSRVLLQQVLQHVRCACVPGAFVPSLLTVLDHTVGAAKREQAHLLPASLSRIVLEEPISQADRSSMRATIGEFVRCLRVVDSRLSSGTEDTDALVRAVCQCAEFVMQGLRSPLPNDRPTKELVRCATDLRNLLPIHLTNPLYQRLAGTQVNARLIFDGLAKRCLELRPKRQVLWPPGEEGNKAYIVAPSLEAVLDTLADLAAGFPIETGPGVVPAVVVTVEDVERLHGMQRIAINVHACHDNAALALDLLSSIPPVATIVGRGLSLLHVGHSGPELVSDPLGTGKQAVRVSLHFYKAVSPAD